MHYPEHKHQCHHCNRGISRDRGDRLIESQQLDTKGQSTHYNKALCFDCNMIANRRKRSRAELLIFGLLAIGVISLLIIGFLG